MNGNPKSIPDMLRDCISDTFGRIRPADDKINFERYLTVYSWPQEWPDMSCGFGGLAAQAFTTAQTFVIHCPTGDALVYHAGKLARHLHCPSAAFWERIERGLMPGATDSWDGLDLVPQEERSDADRA